MRTPRQIYAEYKIMPNLQLHQLRVAAVGRLVCDNLAKPINTHGVVLACLFHDMGNILKFKLDYFPEFLEPEGLEYWEKVKSDYEQKYGADHHGATRKIAIEIGLPDTVISYINAVGFSKAGEVLAGDSYEKKICEYADMRVGPYGVLSLEDRIMDGRKRYIARGATDEKGIATTFDKFAVLLELSKKLEKQIFSSAAIKPEDITDEAIQKSIAGLGEYKM